MLVVRAFLSVIFVMRADQQSENRRQQHENQGLDQANQKFHEIKG
jgi:hypothetical protein